MTSTVKRSTPKLDALTKMLQEFDRGVPQIVVDLPESEAVKLTHGLIERGRPMLKPNREMGLAFVRYAKAGLATVLASGGLLTAQKILEAGMDGVKAHVLLRFRAGNGNDIPVRALTPQWVRRKAALGKPIGVGIFSKDLYKALDRARWSVRRR